MKNIEPRTLKGFRDFLPSQIRQRQYVVNVLKSVFESYGFEPLETPTLEYEDILMGKYGEEGDKLMYRFEDNGGRKVAMRYDQTVPLARVVSQYANELPIPFKRYQIQPVWRAENTQKGRFREFLQCDIDTVGPDTPLADAEIIAATAESLKKLGFENFKILINDRNVFSNLIKETIVKDLDIAAIIRAIDRIKKVGREKVLEEIQGLGYASEQSALILETVQQARPTPRIEEIQKLLFQQGYASEMIVFSPTLARGLDYYTELIIEVELKEYTAGSIAGGGRYNNLIGTFSNNSLPAVGLAFGFDRIVEALEEFNLFPPSVKMSATQVLVTNFEESLLEENMNLVNLLRSSGINSELYLNLNDKLEKQLKYADKKKIKYAVILGTDEALDGTVTVKNLQTRHQQTITRQELFSLLT